VRRFNSIVPFIQNVPVGFLESAFLKRHLTVLTTVLLLPILALSEKKEYGPWCFVIA
jgi:hypothetical protein